MHCAKNKTKIDFLALAVQVEKFPKCEVGKNSNFSKIKKMLKKGQNLRFVIHILKVAQMH